MSKPPTPSAETESSMFQFTLRRCVYTEAEVAELRRQLLRMAMLAYDKPLFNSPLTVWEAQEHRDDILRAAGLIE